MCGLYTVRTRFTTLFGREYELPTAPALKIFPGDVASIIRPGADGAECIGAKWGFRPHWAKRGQAQINARDDHISSSRMFASSLRRRRCLVVADGFFEPNKYVQSKQYYWFQRPDEQPFYFAGIWTRFEREGEDAYDSYALLTTEPNAVVGRVHQRMPAILTENEQADWLDKDNSDPEMLRELLHPVPAAYLSSRRVPDNLYKLARDDPRSLDALE